MLSKQNGTVLPQRVYFTALPSRKEREEYGKILAQLMLERFADPDLRRLAKEYLEKHS